MTRRLITVCGPPGAGKSRLAAALCSVLPGAISADFDDREPFTRLSPAAFEAVLRARGLEGLPLPPLESLPPSGWRGVAVIESAFAPLHPRDEPALPVLHVWIDIPLDVALSRKLRALMARGAPSIDLVGVLEAYETFTRHMLTLQRDRLASLCNLSVSGLSAPHRQAAEILAGLARSA